MGRKAGAHLKLLYIKTGEPTATREKGQAIDGTIKGVDDTFLLCHPRRWTRKREKVAEYVVYRGGNGRKLPPPDTNLSSRGRGQGGSEGGKIRLKRKTIPPLIVAGEMRCLENN